MERSVEDNHEKVKTAIEATKKFFNDKIKHMQNDWIERNAKSGQQFAEVKKNTDSAVETVKKQEEKI